VHDQLGLDVLEVKPVGLESSAGSTPLRLRVAGGPDEYLFAKLYTKGHVRADRGYKLWRTIRYGYLEDERPFQTVRRLTQYEDYALRLLRDAGIRTARPYGIVEITPEREYMIVTESLVLLGRDERPAEEHPDHQPEERALQGDDHRLPADRAAELATRHPHRAHHAELAGALEDRQR